MKTTDALQIVSKFKGNNLKQKLDEIKQKLIKNTQKEIHQINANCEGVYEAALEIKKVSAQIDEVVHSVGILKCLPHILSKGEKVKSLSLASGAGIDGIDLVTSKRIAEFKFSKWQSVGANGTRKQQVFADLVHLYLNQSKPKKELYVFGAKEVVTFFKSDSSTWINVLSKKGELVKRLKKHLREHKIKATYLKDIYCISGVKVLDIADILK